MTFFFPKFQRHYDPEGHRTEYEYDAFEQLVQVREYNVNNASYTTRYGYDLQGNLTQVTDHAGNLTGMTYDLLGRKRTMTDPDMGAWQYGYDGAGNLTSQRDGRGQWLYLEYDALDRLVKRRRDSNTGPLLSEYLYDAVGQKGLLATTRAYGAEGTTEARSVTYDARNRLTRQEWVVPGTGVAPSAWTPPTTRLTT